jgi:hypothetical protein
LNEIHFSQGFTLYLKNLKARKKYDIV